MEMDTHSLIDLLALASVECVGEVLFPNTAPEGRAHVVHCARELLGDLQFSPSRFFQGDFGSRKPHRIRRMAQAQFFERIEPLQRVVLERWAKRLAQGFLNSSNDAGGAMQEVILEVERSFMQPSGSGDVIAAAWEAGRELSEHGRWCQPSIADALIGGAAEAASDWDRGICEYVDGAYDMPYIDTIAIRLRPVSKDVDRLWAWKRIFAPPAYEEARGRLVALLGKHSIPEDSALPY